MQMEGARMMEGTKTTVEEDRVLQEAPEIVSILSSEGMATHECPHEDGQAAYGTGGSHYDKVNCVTDKGVTGCRIRSSTSLRTQGIVTED